MSLLVSSKKGFLYLICHGLLETSRANVMKAFLNFWKGKDLNVNSETKSEGNKKTQTQISSVATSFLLESRYSVKIKIPSVI